MKKLTEIGMGKLGLLVGILFLCFLNIIPPINAQLSCTDIDGDWICDQIEILNGLDPNVSSLNDNLDSDGDGLTNYDELVFSEGCSIPNMNLRISGSLVLCRTAWQYALNPQDTDSDDDGLHDRQEIDGLAYYFQYRGTVLVKTNPSNADTDGDGLLDGAEFIGWLFGNVRAQSDPTSVDTDSDGLPDFLEVGNGPLSNPDNSDTDGDGLNDYDEITKYRTIPSMSDTDNDNLDDGREVKETKSNPNDSDTDNDGVEDGAEILNGTDPLVSDYMAASINTDLNSENLITCGTGTILRENQCVVDSTTTDSTTTDSTTTDSTTTDSTTTDSTTTDSTTTDSTTRTMNFNGLWKVSTVSGADVTYSCNSELAMTWNSVSILDENPNLTFSNSWSTTPLLSPLESLLNANSKFIVPMTENLQVIDVLGNSDDFTFSLHGQFVDENTFHGTLGFEYRLMEYLDSLGSAIPSYISINCPNASYDVVITRVSESALIDSTSTVTEPTVTEPTVTEPTVTEPTVTEPTVTEPTVTQSIIQTDKKIYDLGATVNYNGKAPDVTSIIQIQADLIDNSGSVAMTNNVNTDSSGNFQGYFKLNTGGRWNGDLKIIVTTQNYDTGSTTFCVNDSDRGKYCDAQSTTSTDIPSTSDSPLSTDKQIYDLGSTVRYSGKIPDTVSQVDVYIIDNRGGSNNAGTVSVNPDGTFSDSYKLSTGGRWNDSLQIQIDAGSNRYSTTFCVNDSSRGITCPSGTTMSFGGILESAQKQSLDIMNSESATSTYGKQGYSYGNKAVGTGISVINSGKICGLSLCSEDISMEKRIELYLKSVGLK